MLVMKRSPYSSSSQSWRLRDQQLRTSHTGSAAQAALAWAQPVKSQRLVRTPQQLSTWVCCDVELPVQNRHQELWLLPFIECASQHVRNFGDLLLRKACNVAALDLSIK